ncbi:DUF2336 domain-containing protein [Bradyrhizobium valentinum]|uniref:DUF2336 domain-containing protein n=1 Tax=Bradyrhizobium valentinum TaxID=1518501 RepID=A0A0R3LT42_9BRAD|nr:DUF2336 domain-containing protein [Bradyrhizobium valentinum]KRQ92712.1 hypothetical protein CQ10_36720 [Bradyrhizobium valentinum]KRR11185.1 hypothetical protein CP49_39000 [Bradyrhizobium valentinum]
MVQQPAHSIIAELEDAVRGGSSARRVETLRQVTDLFLHDGERLSDDQVKVFDDVLCLLIARVETRAKAELSKRLAPLDYAPFEVIQHLAWDDEIEVAGSVLASSSRLGTDVLVEIASSKGQDHLLAISGRPNLPAAVTDVIVDRGEDQVIRKLANNAGAQFSEEGYSSIVARASADDELVEILGLRGDLPANCMRDLLRRAKDAVRVRLLAIAPPALQEEIKQVLNTIAREAPPPSRSFGVAEELVKLMKGLNELDDAAVYKFAETNKFDEVTVALAVLNDMPIEMTAKLMEGPRADLLLIPCRSARLNWPTVESILRNRPVMPSVNEQTLEIAQRDYRKLSLETAQRTVRFWQLHNRIEKEPMRSA